MTLHMHALQWYQSWCLRSAWREGRDAAATCQVTFDVCSALLTCFDSRKLTATCTLTSRVFGKPPCCCWQFRSEAGLLDSDSNTCQGYRDEGSVTHIGRARVECIERVGGRDVLWRRVSIVREECLECI